MTNINTIVIAGNMTSDINVTSAGNYGYFNVAVSRGKDKTANFIPVRVYMAGLSDNAKQNMKKGASVLLQGRFESGSYKAQDGTTKYYSFVVPEGPIQIGLGATHNSCTVQGNLVAKPEVRATQSGMKVVNFTVACNRTYKDKQTGEYKDMPSFIDVTAWDKTGDFVEKYFEKGSGIIVDGILASRSYQNKEGQNRTAYSITATAVGFASRNKKDADGTAAPAQSAPAAIPAQPATPTYGNVTAADFEAVDDEDDLPF